MADTTPIEKKSLEAHVDLCAERYKLMEQKLETVDKRISSLESLVKEVHDMVLGMSQRRNDQIISWGAGIIVTLLGVCGWLIAKYVLG
jgi:hypothetical protein